jgi:hypothetical protein
MGVDSLRSGTSVSSNIVCYLWLMSATYDAVASLILGVYVHSECSQNLFSPCITAGQPWGAF